MPERPGYVYDPLLHVCYFQEDYAQHSHMFSKCGNGAYPKLKHKRRSSRNYPPKGHYTTSILLDPGVIADQRGHPWFPRNDSDYFASLQSVPGATQQHWQLPKEYQCIPPPPGGPSDLKGLESDAVAGRGERGNRKSRNLADKSPTKALVSLGLYTKPEELSAESCLTKATKATMTPPPEGRGLKLEEAFHPPKFMKATASGRDAWVQRRFYAERLAERRRTHGWWVDALPPEQRERHSTRVEW